MDFQLHMGLDPQTISNYSLYKHLMFLIPHCNDSTTHHNPIQGFNELNAKSYLNIET